MARPVKYEVRLTQKEKDCLRKNTSSGKWKPQVCKRAQILLKADVSENKQLLDEDIAQQIGCSVSTVRNTKLKFAKGERLKAVEDKPRSGRPKIVDGDLEAHIIATACSAPPEGAVRWTIQLVADKVVKLTGVENCSKSSVHRALKKTNLSLG